MSKSRFYNSTGPYNRYNVVCIKILVLENFAVVGVQNKCFLFINSVITFRYAYFQHILILFFFIILWQYYLVVL